MSTTLTIPTEDIEWLTEACTCAEEEAERIGSRAAAREYARVRRLIEEAGEEDAAIADLERLLIPEDARERLADALEASGVLAVYGDPLDVADSLLSALTERNDAVSCKDDQTLQETDTPQTDAATAECPECGGRGRRHRCR